jgi:two-component sensor histidine kinase
MYNSLIKYFNSYTSKPFTGNEIELIQSFFIPEKLRKRQYFLKEGRQSSAATNSFKNDAYKSYLFIIPVRIKLIFFLRLIFLTIVFLMAAIICKSQSDTVRIALELKAGSQYLLKPGNDEKDLDSAQYFFNQALRLSQSIGSHKWINASLTWKGQCYLEANNLDSGKAYFQKVIDYYHRKGQLAEEANTWRRYGDGIQYDVPRNAPERANSFEQACQLYREIGDSLNALQSLKDAADAHIYEPNLDLAEMELLSVAESYKAMHFRNIHFTYDLLSAVAGLKGDLPKEVFYTMEMVRSLDSVDMKNREDSLLVGRLYSNAGLTYERAAMWDRALFFVRKGWRTLQITDWGDEYFSWMYHLARDLVRNDSSQEALRFVFESTQNRQPSSAFEKAKIATALGICYQAVGLFDNAENEYSKVIGILDNDKLRQVDPKYLVWDQEMMLSIGNFFLSTHKYAKADFYAQRLSSNNTYLITLGQRAKIELFKAQIDSALGRYYSALKHFTTYQQMNDSLFGIQKTVQIQELQMKYALDKKDNDILLQGTNIKLLKKENEFQQMQAGKSRNLRNMLGIALLFLVLLVGMVYNRYRIKQKQNRELELKQEEISAKNQQLEQLLQENKWLLQEVHHRVKNNLQTVTSLLTSQMESVEKGPAVEAIRESRHRIEAIAMIHQRLYNSNNYSSIMMPAYVADLVEHLREAFRPGPRIVFSLFIEPISLDISVALPAALILNEAISNALKHAFPGEMQGTITVRVNHVSDNKVMLEVRDDGIGFSEETVISSKSFGIRLIKGFVSDLSGESQIVNGNGTTVLVFFCIDSLTGKIG